MRKLTVPAAALGVLLALAPAAQAKTRKLPTLLAKATVPVSGKNVAKRVTLGLDPSEFRVVARRSASSVTLGWPADKPCAESTFRLSILPTATDAQAVVDSVIASPSLWGTAAMLGKRQIDGTRPTFRGAWAVRAEIVDNSAILRETAVAAAPLRDFYGDAAGGLLQLRLDSHTTKSRYPCATANKYLNGPGLMAEIILKASS